MKVTKWTDEEINILKLKYNKFPIKDIAKEMNRTYNSVKSKARKLGLQIHKNITICKSNEYYIYNDIAFVRFSNCMEYFLCDAEDWDVLKDRLWYKDFQGYAVSNKKLMHRVIMKTPNNMDTDHIYQVSNGLLDNRKCNLKIKSHIENMWNQKMRKNNTSGYTGVYYDKRRNNWYAQIKVNYKTINLGTFSNPEDAHDAYQLAKRIYHNKEHLNV